MTRTVVVAKAAQKRLAKFPAKDQDKLAAALVAMEADPFFGDIVKLEEAGGREGPLAAARRKLPHLFCR